MSHTILLLCLGWLAFSSFPSMVVEGYQSPGSTKIPRAEVELRKSVGAFWAAWQQKDYQTASRYVLSEQKERFFGIKKFPVRKWEIVEVRLQPGNKQASVTVKVERYEPFMGRYIEWNQSATWMKQSAIWQMQIPGGRQERP